MLQNLLHWIVLPIVTQKHNIKRRLLFSDYFHLQLSARLCFRLQTNFRSSFASAAAVRSEVVFHCHTVSVPRTPSHWSTARRQSRSEILIGRTLSRSPLTLVKLGRSYLCAARWEEERTCRSFLRRFDPCKRSPEWRLACLRCCSCMSSSTGLVREKVGFRRRPLCLYTGVYTVYRYSADADRTIWRFGAEFIYRP